MLKNLLSLSVIFLALLQGPYIYCYASGFMAEILILPYLFVGFFLSVLLLYRIAVKKEKTTKFQIAALIFGIIIGTVSIFSEDFLEKIDWRLRKAQREEIISRIKNGSIKYDTNKSVHHLEEFKYILISNGGNDIAISSNEKNQLKVEFFINRGLLDHYSAFVYTNDPDEIKDIENHMELTVKQNNYKIEKNWYRLNY